MSSARLYAHRGAAIELPENTIQSFAAAVDCGVGGLEMDVHMTLDGVVVVSHDPSGKRMCGVQREIARATYADVSRWDAGWGFVDEEGKRPFAESDYRIPSLADVLDAFPEQAINVDLKQRSPSMVKAVIEIVAQARSEDRVTLASFHQSTLLHIRASGYRGATSLGTAEVVSALLLPPALVHKFPFRGSRAQIPTHHWPLRFDTAETVERFHRAGIAVDFWTINSPAEARRLIELGADGIMTDDPRRLAPVFS